MNVVKIRPPFKYVRRNPLAGTGIISCTDLITDRDIFRGGPSSKVLDNTRRSELGVFVLGAPGRETWITLGANGRYLILKASNSAGRALQYDLTTWLKIRVPKIPVVGVPHLDALYLGGLGRVIKVDLFSLTCSSLEFGPGYESIVEPYVSTSLVPTLGLVRHGRRFVYWFESSIEVPLTVEPVGVQLENGDPSRLLGGARMRLWPSDILYSDPLRPGACKWSSLFTTSGIYGGDVKACVSLAEGLLVLTSSGAWILKGDDVAESVAVQLSEWADCVAPRSVIRLQGATLWVGRRAVWAYISGGGVQMVESVTDALERFGVRDRAAVSGTSFGGGRYLMFYGGGLSPLVMELETGIPCQINAIAIPGNASVFPIAMSGVGTGDEVAIGSEGGLEAIVFDDAGEGEIVFGVPDLVGNVKGLIFMFDGVPDRVQFSAYASNSQCRTDEIKSLPPENQTFGWYKWAWPSQTLMDGGAEVLVDRHSLFDRERFQGVAEDKVVRWEGGALSIEIPAGIRVGMGEVFIFSVRFRGARFLGADVLVSGSAEEAAQ